MQIHVARNGQQSGPYSEAQVREMLASGSISPSDLAWHEGLAGWTSLESLLSPTGSPPVLAPVTIPQGPTLDPNLAGRGTRLGAKALDTLILFVCIAPGIVTLAVADKNDAILVVGGILIALALIALVVAQLYLLSTRGHTLGKKLVGIRIVTFADNQNPGFVKACLVRAIVPGIIGGIPYLGFLFSITDICFIFRDDRRCIHDLMAETKVVNVS